MQHATFAGGCFWCTEAIFQRLKGMTKVASGYSGGKVANPTYEQVCSGNTGHVEAIQIEFDPQVISYDTLLEVFFKLHDPTTLNQQGNDVGTQYRSVIFYHDTKQKEMAESFIEKLNNSGNYKNKLVTEISPYSQFYSAEAYHQEYYNKNKQYPYCQYVIDPKITKLYKEFAPFVRDETK